MSKWPQHTPAPSLRNPLPDERIRDFFDRMREALEAAGQIKKPDPGQPVDPVFAWFETACLARLKMGAESYGAANFLRPDVDLVTEALEENLDFVNYGLMEMVKHSPDDTDAAALGAAICYAFHSAQCLLRYRDKVRGG